MSHLPTVNQAYVMIMRDENQRVIASLAKATQTDNKFNLLNNIFNPTRNIFSQTRVG